jgi:hypothetical protein
MMRIRKRCRIGWFVRACKRVDGDGVDCLKMKEIMVKCFG